VVDGRVTLVYDGECEFCTRLARWVERRDRRGRVSARASQEARVIESLRLTREEVGRAAWAVEANGRKFEGAAAINRVLRELGGGWPLLGSLYLLAPFKWVEDRYYTRVARKRAWW
jgi:predicted DCC family thiol-disulfide oxidoreductase YuxK